MFCIVLSKRYIFAMQTNKKIDYEKKFIRIIIYANRYERAKFLIR